MLWGLNGLSKSSQRIVSQANELVWRTFHICKLIHDSGGVFILEHPEDPGPPFPSIFASREIEALRTHTGAKYVSLCQCMYGAPSKKPTRLLGTASGLHDVCLMCNHSNHALILAGRNSEGKFFTAAAQQYPLQFNAALAQATLHNLLPPTTSIHAQEEPLGSPQALKVEIKRRYLESPLRASIENRILW
jgi:hypothetical protein